MFDINRIVILILIGTLLYALYMYQQQLPVPGLPFIGFLKSEGNNIKKKKKSRKNKKSKSENNKDKKSKRSNRDRDIDLISIDNISQASLGSLLDVDSQYNDIYKQAPELNSLDTPGTFGSLLNESTEGTMGDIEGFEGNGNTEDFFFQ